MIKLMVHIYTHVREFSGAKPQRWWPLILLLVKKRFFRISPCLVMCKRHFKMQKRQQYVGFPQCLQKFQHVVLYCLFCCFSIRSWIRNLFHKSDQKFLWCANFTIQPQPAKKWETILCGILLVEFSGGNEMCAKFVCVCFLAFLFFSFSTQTKKK